MLDVDPAAVVGAARTAIRTYGGSLSKIDSYEPGSTTIEGGQGLAAILERP